MNKKIKMLIIPPVLAGVLLVAIFINYEKDRHNISRDIESDISVENDLVEIHATENKNDVQPHNDSQVINAAAKQQNNEFQDAHEMGSLVDWVNQIDNIVSSKALDADSKAKKIVGWLRDSNTPDEIRVKLYRALVQLKPIDRIEEIFSLIEGESNPGTRLAGIEALALLGKQLIVLGYTEGQLVINLLKIADQEMQEPATSKKLNSLIVYMEDALAGDKNEMIEIEYLTGKDSYIWDLSAKLEDRANLKSGLGSLLNDVSVLVDQDKELLNEEYSKLNLAYLDYFANGFKGDIPDYQDMAYFFEQIKPKTEEFTMGAVSRYRTWLAAYSYSSERDSSDYNNFILNELKEVDSPVAALVLVEGGINVIDQLDLPTRERLVSLLAENDVAAEGELSGEVAEALGFLMP
ncbi:MAG TPA: hypothetical protein ENK04_04290 [Gammaproteobacteria bacterium]|nr:hypothetical protein [Gammaproteobacteria bacterium]